MIEHDLIFGRDSHPILKRLLSGRQAFEKNTQLGICKNANQMRCRFCNIWIVVGLFSSFSRTKFSYIQSYKKSFDCCCSALHKPEPSNQGRGKLNFFKLAWPRQVTAWWFPKKQVRQAFFSWSSTTDKKTTKFYVLKTGQFFWI